MTFSIDNPRGLQQPPVGKYVWEKPSGEQGLKLLSRAHRPTHTKNMVRHIKTAFENLKNNKKTYDPPFSLSKKT